MWPGAAEPMRVSVLLSVHTLCKKKTLSQRAFLYPSSLFNQHWFQDFLKYYYYYSSCGLSECVGAAVTAWVV